MRALTSTLPRLERLCQLFRQGGDALDAYHFDSQRHLIDVSVPVQTSIELAADGGHITAVRLLRGLLENPRTHLLRALAAELRLAGQR